MIGLRVGICAVLFLTTMDFAQAEHPLLASVRLGETQFKDWRYGHRAYRKQVNCVQFMVAVVEDLIQRELTADERAGILISRVRGRRTIDALVRKDDNRIRGIQSALVAMGKGEVVAAGEARPGDFIQYWKRMNGRWVGHSAVIIDVMKRGDAICSVVFGSHRSVGKVGVSDFEVGLNDPAIKAYIVRYKP